MQAWEEFLQQQEVDLGRETVEKWLRSLKIQRFDACNLYLEAKDSFQALWFEEHIRGKAHLSLFNGNHKKIKIHLNVNNANENSGKKPKSKVKSSFNPFNAPFQLNFDELDPHATFEQFIPTEDNDLTLKILHEISGISTPENRGVSFFNPVYIHGPSGSGKTHLLMSLAHAYKAQGLNAIYARAETFTSHVVTAIRAGQMNVFRQAYRNADILIIDDVHVFSKKGATQEEFFHTFNTLHLENKQIILASNRLPQELQSVEPRLVSRFEWGIVLPLRALGLEELKKLLESKQQALNFHLPPKISEFLLESFTSHPKALIKSLEALILRLHLGQEHTIQELTIPAAKILLNDLVQEEIKSAITPQKIVEAASAHFGIRTEDILGKAQTKECTLPRQISMHFCRHKLKLPFTKIGDIFNRDHSTVMASVRFIQKSLDMGHKDISTDWHAIEKKLAV